MADYMKVCRVTDVPLGSVKVLALGDRRIVVCNAAGSFYAVADLCSHDNGPLGEGELVDHQIECPRHGARFDIKTGKAMCLPAVTPIPAYPVEIRGEELWVGMPNA